VNFDPQTEKWRLKVDVDSSRNFARLIDDDDNSGPQKALHGAMTATFQ